jgi:peptide/nickel transport system substrate-binding protein
LEYVKAIDDYTVEFKTINPDPIFASRAHFVRIADPKFSQENPDLLATTLIGTGPYKFVEWEKGQHFKLTANEEYWGGAPEIKEVTILFREEPTVRAAMVQAGEADLAWTINPEDITSVPKAVQYPDLRTITMRVDATGQNPALADVRVRQALLYAVDTKIVMDTLFKDVAIQVKGNQQCAPAVLGYDPNMEPWPYDPEKAKELLAEAEADGVPIDTPIKVVERGIGWFPRDNEFAEYVVNVWNELGLNASLEVLESAAWVDVLFAVKPEETHGDLVMFLHSVELMDYSHSADRFLYSDARISLWQDEQTDEMLSAAAQLTGEERAKAYREIAHYLEDKVPFLVFGSVIQTHATHPDLQWDPRPDGLGNFWEMSFSE